MTEIILVWLKQTNKKDPPWTQVLKEPSHPLKCLPRLNWDCRITLKIFYFYFLSSSLYKVHAFTSKVVSIMSNHGTREAHTLTHTDWEPVLSIPCSHKIGLLFSINEVLLKLILLHFAPQPNSLTKSMSSKWVSLLIFGTGLVYLFLLSHELFNLLTV